MKHTRKFSSAAIITIIILMIVKWGVLFSFPASGIPAGDSAYYVSKARFLYTHGRFPASAEMVQEHAPTGVGQRWSDFRPPGYPVMLAPLMMFGSDSESINYSSRLLNMLMDLAVTIGIWLLAMNFSRSRVYQVMVSIGLGLQPWTSAYVISIVPDTVTGALSLAGILSLAGFVSHAHRPTGRFALVGGMLLLSITMLIRPEMILMSFVLGLCAILLARPTWRQGVAYGMTAVWPASVRQSFKGDA